MISNQQAQDQLALAVLKAASTRGGVYEIVNMINGRRYIGSSQNLAARWRSHKKRLGQQRHSNPPLQAAWNKHGAEAFQFSPLAILEDCEILPTEQRLLDVMFKSEQLYNVAIDVTSGMKGRTHSKATCEVLSRKHIAYFAQPGIREQHSRIKKAHGADPAVREHLSAAGKKHFESAESRQQESTRQQAHITDAFRKSQSDFELARKQAHPESVAQQALSLRKHFEDPANRKKISDGMKRYNATPEGQAEIERKASALRGTKQSVESNRKRAASLKRTNATTDACARRLVTFNSTIARRKLENAQ